MDDSMGSLSLMINRNRARSRRKKRAEELPKIDPNKEPSTLDLVFAEAAAATAEVRTSDAQRARKFKKV